jgi:ATP/ADP translocase
MIQYHFLSTLDNAFADDLQFQAFYGTYKVGLIIAILLFQWLVTGRLLERIGLKSSFAIFPIILLVAAGSGLALPGIVGATAGVFLITLIELAWDQPSRKSLQGLIPDERRGRVSTFLDSYVLAVTTIIACLILLLLFWISSITQLPDQLVTIIYLTVSVAAAAGAVWAAIKLRRVYDQSMLNWRLSRRQRRGLTGVMHKLDI